MKVKSDQLILDRASSEVTMLRKNCGRHTRLPPQSINKNKE